VIVSELLYSALRLAGVLGQAGRTASATEMTDAFTALNNLVDNWNAEKLAVYAIEKKVVALTASTAEYTIGTGGAFAFPRPPKIEAAHCIVGTPAIDQVIKVCSPAEWAAILIKGETTNLGPRNLFYEATLPLGKVYFHPIPSATMGAALFVWSQLAAFASQAATVTLPTGYLDAVIYNLAVDLSLTPRFVRFPMDPAVVGRAAEYKAALKAHNAELNFGLNTTAPAPGAAA
jgi:hypothetical protein